MTRVWVLLVVVACSSPEKVDPKTYLESRAKLATVLNEATKPLANASGASVLDAILSVVQNGKLVVDLLQGFKSPGTIPTGWEPCMAETKLAIDDLKGSLAPVITKALKIADDPTEFTGAIKIAAAWDQTQTIAKKAICRFRQANSACEKLAKDQKIDMKAFDSFTGNAFADCKSP